MKKIILSFFHFFIFSFLLPVAADAQQNKPLQIYEKAEQDYNAGRFSDTESALLGIVKSLKGLHKTSAYRLLALCELEEGDQTGARGYVDLMLKSDPYYTPTLSDPQRLVDIINEAKEEQSGGITTASRHAESEDETPVPVTVITEDMIRLSGATTLQELLCMFVPGMSNIEGVESNIAMHGIYDLFQNKILFMQDGHRLNGSSTNAEAPDYRNSLDKIQQIEVLRGPASSLYGNVALTAVVNIITRKGGSLNGGRVAGTIGTQQTYGGSLVVGGGNNVVDVMGWGSMNYTKGFKHEFTNEIGGTSTLYSGGYTSRPSYDVGIKARWGEFSMTVSSQRSKRNPYVNILQFPCSQQIIFDQQGQMVGITPTTPVYDGFTNFNIEKYGNVGSNGPGITRTNHHLNFDFSHDIGKVNLQASVYVSMESTSLYNVMGDTISSSLGRAMLMSLAGTDFSRYDKQTQAILMSMYVKTKGVFQVMNWDNLTFGGQLQATVDYRKILGHGTFIFGTQFDSFRLTNGTLFLGGNFSTQQMISSGDVFEKGGEMVLSGFVQVKHYFNDRLIFNGGLRYDHKKRFSNDRLNYFSPRASLIYKLNSLFSLRGSFNCSFVDAAYVYRACNVAMFSGGAEMLPEKMNSLQASLSYHGSKHLKAELSLFYNNLTNLVTQSSSRSMTSTEASEQYLFKNAGKVRQGGADLSAQYTMERFFASFNATWQRVFSSEKYNVYGSNRLGVPEVMGNIVVAWMPYKSKNNGSSFFSQGRLWINANTNIQTVTYYQVSDAILTSAMGQFMGEFLKVNPQATVSFGATYSWKGMEINVTAKNLTNNQYLVGSSLNAGIPHGGRQLIGKITFKF